MKHTGIWLRAAVSGLSLSAVFVGGCKVDQARDVETYRRVLGASPTTRRADRLAPNQPVSLRQAMVLANDHDEQLSISGESYLQALINKRRTFESAFIPTVGGSASYGLSNSGQRDNTFSLGGRTNHSLQAGVSEQLNLFNGFADVNSVRRAQYVAEQRRWQLLDLQNSVMLDVANTYYNVLISESQVDVLRDTVTLQDQRIADQNARLRTGMARPLDVLQSQADAANTRVQLTRAINSVHTGRVTLASLIGVPAVTGPLSDELPIPIPDFDLDAMIRDALATRQDLQAAHAAVEAARQSVKVAVARYYPSIDLSLSQALYRDPASGGNWAASLPLHIPIFDLTIREDVRTAWSQFRQAALSEMGTERQVATDIQTAYFNLTSSEARIRDSKVGVDAAESAYRLAQRSYQAGTATNLDVLTAQNQMLTARLDLVTEQLNFKLFYLQLLRQQGRLNIPTLPTSRPTTRAAITPATQP